MTTIGLVVQSPETQEADLSRTLSHMRPFAKMLVIASGQDYVEVMLTACAHDIARLAKRLLTAPHRQTDALIKGDESPA